MYCVCVCVTISYFRNMPGTGWYRWVVLKPPDWEVYDEHVDRQLLGRDSAKIICHVYCHVTEVPLIS